MNFIELSIKGISYSQVQTGAYVLILEDTISKKKISIIIGGFEAQSIAIALENNVTSPRPLTHDLFISFAIKFNIKVSYIVIYNLKEGVFYSNIVFVSNDSKKEESIDSRTSDAIAIAVRFKVPIYTYSEIVEKAGIDIEFDLFDEDSPENSLPNNSNRSLEEIQKEIDQALINEDYEKAARLRDEFKKKYKIN